MTFKVHSTFMTYKFWATIVECLAVLLVGLFTIWSFSFGNYLIWFLLAVGGLFICELIYMVTYKRNTRLMITDDRVVIRKGKLYYREVSIPLEKVYATIKKQNVFQKNMGLMTLEIQTSAKAYQISGIATAEGEELIANWTNIVVESQQGVA